VQDVCNRTLHSSEQAVAFIGSGRPLANWNELRHADITLLSVTDDQIIPCCDLLAERYLDANCLIFHCSGALPSHVMASARACGSLLASVHPVRSFADPAEVLSSFNGTFCGVEGDAAALATLQPVFHAIGARCVMIDPNAKTLYHAAAVFACNYLNTLVDMALQTYVAAGVSEAQAKELAQPLIQQTLNNIFRLGPAQSLSGPVARGDWATVERQHQAVAAWNPALGQIYQLLAEQTALLAARKKID
jgi:predicted short-subunit dehydrogenase-like oxidoreductase (DUF2520 family)